MARIQDHQIGVFDRGRLGVAFPAEKIGHALSVVHIHLAAERLHEDLACGQRWRILAGGPWPVSMASPCAIVTSSS